VSTSVCVVSDPAVKPPPASTSHQRIFPLPSVSRRTTASNVSVTPLTRNLSVLAAPCSQAFASSSRSPSSAVDNPINPDESDTTDTFLLACGVAAFFTELMT